MSQVIVARVDADVTVWADNREHTVSVKTGDVLPDRTPADRAVARVLLDAGQAEPDDIPDPEPSPSRRRKEK